MDLVVERHLGAVERSVSSLERDGQPARAVTLARSYGTTVDDLWDAVTNGVRIPRWFLPISGDLKLGGRYQLEGNAGGVITACARPSHLALTWEFGGDVSWVEVRCADDGAGRARLTLTHTAHVSEHWAKYGPGAVGVGWELGLMGLAILLTQPNEPKLDEAAFSASPEALGRRLFDDPRLSVDQSRACSDCHQAERAFSDGKRVAVGVRDQKGTRNAPAILNRTFGRAFFWDGRAATLEEQVLLPIQHPKEMDADLPSVIERLRADATYRRQFGEVFGRPPDASALSYALATYVRTILAGASDYDRFEAGDATALSPEAQLGLRLFRGRAHCTRCHAGSNFTDEDFHNTGVSWGRRPYDAGRAVVTGVPEDTGKFKTPTLREIERTAPYMHDGSIATLENVIELYDRGGNDNPFRDRELRPLSLTAEENPVVSLFFAGKRTCAGQSVRRPVS